MFLRDCNLRCLQLYLHADGEPTGPYCGDGILNGPENCDDGNASACGTCSATCSRTQNSPAAGSISSEAWVSDYRDGETFTLDDGLNTAVTFEIDKNGQVVTPHVRVDIANWGDPTPESVVGLITERINSIASALRITAQSDSTTVRLVHDFAGTFGNRAISENVATLFFTVSGMSGGSGRDCTQGTGCTQDADCQPNLVCKPSRVCELP